MALKGIILQVAKVNGEHKKNVWEIMNVSNMH